ncbi:hypothetical protein EYB26_009380 [Talaromyces marneffei]|uniref:uncharacterized protein n=1 Tax=Talaromyces marneffei TaxID=37727 RepID=UPI0012A9DFCC|nr:uncharacterized protein EYB26_009380 [Talaromyces marneffei]QGA21669.1 hypothetical protein EYB26_009380 [Talaromyces marneffei]
MASCLSSPGRVQKEQVYRGLETRAIAPAQDHQQPSFGDRAVGDVRVKPRQSTLDALQRERETHLQLTPMPSTPPPRSLAPSDLSPATLSVWRRLFSSPPVPLEFPDENRPPGSLALGITGSPNAGRTQPYGRKRILTAKGAQGSSSGLLIDEKDKLTPASDTEGTKDHKKKKGKQNHTRSQIPGDECPSQITASSLPLAQQGAGKSTIASDSNASDTNPNPSSARNCDTDVDAQFSGHSKLEPPLLAQVSSNQHPAAKLLGVSKSNDSDTDSDTTSDSDIDFDAELFGHLKEEPPKPARMVYRGYLPPCGGDYNYLDYWDASVRDHERLLHQTQRRSGRILS